MTRRIEFIGTFKESLVTTDAEGNDIPYFSNKFLIEKYLKMSDADLELNEKYKREEKLGKGSGDEEGGEEDEGGDEGGGDNDMFGGDEGGGAEDDNGGGGDVDSEMMGDVQPESTETSQL